MAIPALSEAVIRQGTTAESFRRGQSYYWQGHVVSLVQRGDLLQAKVEGSQYLPYRVRVSFDEGGIKAKYYHHAVDWLARARAAYQAAGREAEWQAYLGEIRTRHGRKYKLMGMLKGFE